MTKAITYQSIAIIGALILALLVITSTSRAVWTGTTEAVSTVGAGNVNLTDDNYVNTPFEALNMRPGEIRIGCINVTYTGSLNANVDLTSIGVAEYGASPRAKIFADNVYLVVERFDSADCGGLIIFTHTRANDTLGLYFGTTHQPLSSTWAATGGVETVKSYRVTVTMKLAAPNNVQGQSVTIILGWTATMR